MYLEWTIKFFSSLTVELDLFHRLTGSDFKKFRLFLKIRSECWSGFWSSEIFLSPNFSFFSFWDLQKVWLKKYLNTSFVSYLYIFFVRHIARTFFLNQLANELVQKVLLYSFITAPQLALVYNTTISTLVQHHN